MLENSQSGKSNSQNDAFNGLDEESNDQNE